MSWRKGQTSQPRKTQSKETRTKRNFQSLIQCQTFPIAMTFVSAKSKEEGQPEALAKISLRCVRSTRSNQFCRMTNLVHHLKSWRIVNFQDWTNHMGNRTKHRKICLRISACSISRSKKVFYNCAEGMKILFSCTQTVMFRRNLDFATLMKVWVKYLL